MINKSLLLFALLFLITLGACNAQIKGNNQLVFEPKWFIYQQDTIPYQIHIPKLEKNKKYPVILTLHGASERGTDNKTQLIHTRLFFTKDKLKSNPCYIISPQCNKGYKWVEVPWSAKSHSMPDKPSRYISLTKALLDSICLLPSVDTQRVYIIGLSMGGYGTWDMISRWNHLFAAAIPICGGGDEQQAKQCAQVPTRVYHGALDKLVPTLRSRNMVAAHKQYNPNNILYFEYPEVGHDVWNQVATDTALIPWLFSQRRER